MKPKAILLLVLTVLSLWGCSKQDEFPNNNSYMIDYKENQSYTQIFYYGGGANYISADGGHKGNWYSSQCERVTFYLYDYDSNYTAITPSNEQIKNLETLNKGNTGKEHKYYLTADINFLYESGRAINHILKSNWKMVIGTLEEYIYDGKVYKRLVIKEQVKE